MSAPVRITSPLAFVDELAAQSADPAEPVAAPLLHLIAFQLDGEEYGVPVASVREVSRVGEIRPRSTSGAS
jgi:chemotaxis signal transduction protein